MRGKFKLFIVAFVFCSVKAMSQDVSLDSMLDAQVKAKK